MIPSPEHLGSVTFQVIDAHRGEYRCVLPASASVMRRALVLFEGTSYPFERHYRHVRHANPELPYTFSNMRFTEDPPGLRVGPWPGWRGIPSFPEIRLHASAGQIPVTFQAWGDEIETRTVRGVAWIPPDWTGEVRCTVEDPRLVPVAADVYADEPLRAGERPVQLHQRLWHAHPRLLVTAEDIARLRTLIHGSHAEHWSRIQTLLHAPPLAPAVTAESKTMPGSERLRLEDRALLTAFVALLEPDDMSRTNARDAFRHFLNETQRKDYGPLTIDTQAGETLFLLCTCYDWLHGVWDQAEREAIVDGLVKVAGIVRGHLGSDRTDYAQAHYLGCALGLLAFALLFYEERTEAPVWAAECRGALGVALNMLPDDGFFPHGINLWIYEYGFLLRWIELLRVATGEDLWQVPHWSNASAFRAASTTPDGLYGMTFGDPQYRVGGDSWCHYLIASRTGSGEAQWLGDLLLHGSHEGVDFRSIPPRRRVYELLYYDPSVVGKQPGPGIRLFEDGGQAFCRGTGASPWSVTFRAGPPIGVQRYRAGERGAYGHGDPMNGSFLVSREGGLVISGPGPTYRRTTSLHNTITVNGKGQIGDSTVWLPDFIPPHMLCPLPESRIVNGCLSLSVDLAPAYLPYLGVLRCRRTLYIDPDNLILGVDDVACNSVSTIAWSIHSWGGIEQLSGSRPTGFRIAGGSSGVWFFSPELLSWKTGWTELVPAYPNDGRRDLFLRGEVKGREARFVWALVLGREGSPPRWKEDNKRPAFVLADGTVLRYRNTHFSPELDYDQAP